MSPGTSSLSQGKYYQVEKDVVDGELDYVIMHKCVKYASVMVSREDQTTTGTLQPVYQHRICCIEGD